MCSVYLPDIVFQISPRFCIPHCCWIFTSPSSHSIQSSSLYRPPVPSLTTSLIEVTLKENSDSLLLSDVFLRKFIQLAWGDFLIWLQAWCPLASLSNGAVTIDFPGSGKKEGCRFRNGWAIASSVPWEEHMHDVQITPGGFHLKLLRQ